MQNSRGAAMGGAEYAAATYQLSWPPPSNCKSRQQHDSSAELKRLSSHPTHGMCRKGGQTSDRSCAPEQ